MHAFAGFVSHVLRIMCVVSTEVHDGHERVHGLHGVQEQRAHPVCKSVPIVERHQAVQGPTNVRHARHRRVRGQAIALDKTLHGWGVRKVAGNDRQRLRLVRGAVDDVCDVARPLRRHATFVDVAARDARVLDDEPVRLEHWLSKQRRNGESDGRACTLGLVDERERQAVGGGRRRPCHWRKRHRGVHRNDQLCVHRRARPWTMTVAVYHTHCQQQRSRDSETGTMARRQAVREHVQNRESTSSVPSPGAHLHL